MGSNDEGTTVNLCEDMRPHTHDEKSFQKLSGLGQPPKKKKPLSDKPKDKQNFHNQAKNGDWGEE